MEPVRAPLRQNHNPHAPHVALIAGPGGSGKSSTAARIAQEPNWVHLSEDTYWDQLKAGRPQGEPRTEAEELVVQQRLFDDLLAHHLSGRNVVVEFILYQMPPTPLQNYMRHLEQFGIGHSTFVLKPSASALRERILARGRPEEMNLEEMQLNIDRQLLCLGPEWISPDLVHDTSSLSLEEFYQRVVRPVLDGSSAA